MPKYRSPHCMILCPLQLQSHDSYREKQISGSRRAKGDRTTSQWLDPFSIVQGIPCFRNVLYASGCSLCVASLVAVSPLCEQDAVYAAGVVWYVSALVLYVHCYSFGCVKIATNIAFSPGPLDHTARNSQSSTTLGCVSAPKHAQKACTCAPSDMRT